MEVTNMFKVDSARVRSLVLQSGLPFSEFAQKAQLNVLTVKRAMRDGASASIRTIAALARAFGVPADELILS